MKNEIKRKLLAICCVGVSVCAIVLAAMLGQKHIDFAEYATFEYKGANGYAGVSCHMDKEKLYNDLAHNENNTEKLNLYRGFVDSVSVMTTQMDLSNGDKVYARVNYDVELARQAGIRVGTDALEAWASGIPEGQVVDLFEGIEVVFTGISPDAKVVINNKHTNEYVAGLVYLASKTEGVTVGDEITVSCQVSEAELGRMGYVAKRYAHIYKAEYLSTYVQEPGQISDSVKMSLQQEIEAGLEKLVKDTTFRIMYKATGDAAYLRMPNEESISNISFEEARFLKRKLPSLEGVDNYLVYLYSADVTIGGAGGTDDKNTSVTEKVYFAVEYSQGYITHQGEIKIESGKITERYSCSTDYSTIVSSTLVGGKPGYNSYEVTKYTNSNL